MGYLCHFVVALLITLTYVGSAVSTGDILLDVAFLALLFVVGSVAFLGALVCSALSWRDPPLLGLGILLVISSSLTMTMAGRDLPLIGHVAIGTLDLGYLALAFFFPVRRFRRRRR